MGDTTQTSRRYTHVLNRLDRIREKYKKELSDDDCSTSCLYIEVGSEELIAWILNVHKYLSVSEHIYCKLESLPIFQIFSRLHRWVLDTRINIQLPTDIVQFLHLLSKPDKEPLV